MGAGAQLGRLSDPLRALLDELRPGPGDLDNRRVVLDSVCLAAARAAGLGEPTPPFGGGLVDDDVVATVATRVAAIAPGHVPWLVVAVHEALLAPAERRRRGAHATPASVAIGLCRSAVDGGVADGSRPRVVDRSVGAGAFVVAAATVLAEVGVAPEVLVEELIAGCDVDEVAVALARWNLATWAVTRGAPRPEPDPTRLLVGDGLAPDTLGVDATFDLVVGNPPFLSQLADETRRSEPERTALRDRFGSAVSGYVDTAAAFVAAGVDDLDGDGSSLAMVVPESLLVSRDAAGVRRMLAETCSVRAIWSGGRGVFDAAVGTCGIVATSGRSRTRVRRLVGPEVTPAGEVDAAVLGDDSWAAVLAGMRSVPSLEASCDGGTVGDVARVVAGFRDQYYAIVDAVEEADGADARRPAARRPLVTVGMIDPFDVRHGRGEFRFARRRWRRPVVDADRLEATSPTVAAWYRDLATPKVCVATQTKVVEAAIDDTGSWFAVTPVISVVPTADHDVWHMAAALGAPAVSAWVANKMTGSGLSADAVRVTAPLLRRAPLPVDADAWASGAELVASMIGHDGPPDPPEYAAFAAAMADAYRCDEAVTAWWLERLPRRAS